MTDIIVGSVHDYSSSCLYTVIRYEKKRSGADMLYRFYYKIYIAVRGTSTYNPAGYYQDKLYATFYLNGNAVWSKVTESPNKGWSFEFTSDWFTVTNKVTGTTPFKVTIIDYQNSWCNYTSAVQYLPVDPAGNKLKGVSNFNIGASFNADVTKYSSMYDVLNIKIGSTTIKTINGASSSNSITFNSSELDSIYTIVTGQNATFTFNLTTYEDSSKNKVVDTDSTTAIGYIVNSNPEIVSHYFYDLNAGSRNLTGDYNVQILNISSTEVNAYVVGKNKAGIKSVTINGVATTYVQYYDNIGHRFYAVFNAPTTNSYEIIVTDTRGFSSKKTITCSYINYKLVNMRLTYFNRNQPTDGKVRISYVGDYFNGSFGATNNQLWVEYRYKEQGGSFTNWISLNPTLNVNGYDFAQSDIVLDGFDYKKQYEFEFKARDKINEKIITNNIISIGQPIYNWDKEHFNINGYLTVLDYIQAKNLVATNFVKIPKSGSQGAGLINSDGFSIIRDHANSNVTIDATGGTLFLGYSNTNSINMLDGKARVNEDGTITAPNISRLGHFIECDYTRHTQSFSSWTSSTVTNLSQRRINGNTLSLSGNGIKANVSCKALFIVNLSTSKPSSAGDSVIDIMCNSSSVSSSYKTPISYWEIHSDFVVLSLNAGDVVSVKYTIGNSGTVEFLDQSSLIGIVLNT